MKKNIKNQTLKHGTLIHGTLIQKGLGILLLVFSILSEANQNSDKLKSAVLKLSACSNFIRYDDQFIYTGFGFYGSNENRPRPAQPAKIIMKSIASLQEKQIPTLDSAIDFIRVADKGYVLTYSGIELWDLRQNRRIGLYATHLLSRPLRYQEHPTAFALYKNKLIIAHGRLGFSFFDLTSNKISRAYPILLEQRPLESMVTGVTVVGKYAYASIDNFTLVSDHQRPAFRGVFIIDLDSESIMSQLHGLDPGSDSLIADNKVIILSFYGQPLYKYSLNSLTGSQLPQPLKRVWRFPVEGHPTGKASLDETNYYSCYLKAPPMGEGSNFKRVPMVLDRRVFMLD